APGRQSNGALSGSPSVGTLTPQASVSRPRRLVTHLVERFGLSATTKLSCDVKCARLTVKTVPSGPMAGATLMPGRCAPQLMSGGRTGDPSAFGGGGHGRSGGGFMAANVVWQAVPCG